MNTKKILLLSLGHLSCDINSGALPAILPFLRASYGLNYQAAGGLMFAYASLSSVIQPLFGLLADRFSRSWFMPLGILLAGCGLAAVGFLHDYTALFAAIALSGLGAALFHPEGARHAHRLAGQQKGAGLSLFAVGGNSGFMLGPLLATASLSILGLHGTAIFACLAIGTAILVSVFIARQLPAPSGEHRPDTQEHALPDTTQAPLHLENNWREFSRLSMAIIVRSMLFMGFNTFLPLYWISTFGQSQTAGALALTIYSTCGVLGNVAGGFLSDRYGIHTILRGSFLCMPLLIFCFSLVDTLAVAYALLPLLGIAIFIPFSPMVVLGQQLLAKNIGFASGVTLGLGASMGGIALPVLGWIADNYGLTLTFQCLGFTALLGSLFAFSLSPQTNPH